MTLLATTGEAVSGTTSETTVLPKWWTEYSGIIFLGFALLAYSIGGTRFGLPMALFLAIAIIVAANKAILSKTTTTS
jgi:hypothetical protein